jgi:hypothetical protein
MKAATLSGSGTDRARPIASGSRASPNCLPAWPIASGTPSEVEVQAVSRVWAGRRFLAGIVGRADQESRRISRWEAWH